MPTAPHCTYHYDPLDRLTGYTVAAHTPIPVFYCKSRLATFIDHVINRSIFQQDNQLLAQSETQGNTQKITILATDKQRSVLYAIQRGDPAPFAYSPYGHRVIGGGLLSLLGFNGERADPVTGHYLLGNGYRAFNPILMRFNSPDSWSPFKQGGINPYTYCLGDPINKIDPNGRAGFFNTISKFFRRMRNSTIPGVVHHRSSPSIAFHATPTYLSEVETLTFELTPMTNTSKFQIIHTTQREYPTNSTGAPDLTRPLTTTTSMFKITSKHPTLLEIAHSKTSNFKALHPISFDRRLSLTKFHNHLEQEASDTALRRHNELSDYGKRFIYNKALLEAKAGNLQGVDPKSITYLRPAEDFEQYVHNRIEIIRRIL